MIKLSRDNAIEIQIKTYSHIVRLVPDQAPNQLLRGRICDVMKQSLEVGKAMVVTNASDIHWSDRTMLVLERWKLWWRLVEILMLDVESCSLTSAWQRLARRQFKTTLVGTTVRCLLFLNSTRIRARYHCCSLINALATVIETLYTSTVEI